MVKSAYHIAFYCSSESWGGLEINTLRYARWMQEAGFRITVFFPDDTPLAKEARESGLTLITIRRNRKYFDFSNALRIANLFSSNQIQLIWFRDTRDMDLLGWVKRISNLPLKLLYQQAMQFGVSKRDALHTFRFIPVDAWVSSLHFLAEQVKRETKFPSERIHVIPLGTELLPPSPDGRMKVRDALGLHSNVVLAGIVGRIDPLKDQLTAVRALHFIQDRYPDAHLLITGESTRNEGNDYERSLRRQVNHLDLQNRVHFLPHTNAVSDIYAALDLFILTSQGETFGTVTIEAMQQGLPVIGTNSSGTPEILGQGEAGLLFTPGSAEELAGCWSQLLSDPGLRDQLGEAARQRARSLYTREASVNQLSNLVKRLMDKSAQPAH